MIRTQTPLGWYLEQIKSSVLLTAEQERQLSRRVREHGDAIAREQMVHANLRLVVKIAKQYSSPTMTLGDLVAEGNLGLMRAVEEFNPDAGVRFSTYAAWWIRQAINGALVNTAQPIRIPAYLVKFVSRWRRATAMLEAELGHPLTTEEMAKHLKVSKKKAEIIRQGIQAVNAPTQVATDEAHAIGEMLADGGGNEPDHAMMDASTVQTVCGLLNKLDERSRTILIKRFGLDGSDGPQPTYKEIGKEIGLTRERVRQLEKQALATLHGLAEDLL